jgi:nitrogen-specific signal transduction histidine kinase/ActR/RegA family two-component response regulator
VDITAQKELEDQLRQAQKMEAVGQLAGGVAHDFNNILAVILGNTELVLEGSQTILSREAVECLDQVAAAARRASDLTRQLLAYSRKQVLRARLVNMNDVIGNIAGMLKRIIGEDIELQCSFGQPLPLVRADAGMIEQVLVNFVVNSRDAMPQGGKVTVRTERLSLAGRSLEHPEGRPGDFLLLSVSDTGEGIAAEHLPRLFEPFFTTKDVGKGTGLGLATVHGIVKQHQGWIEVASQHGAGAMFRVYLPVVDAPNPPEEIKASESPPRGGQESVLLVEDDEAVSLLTRRVLTGLGYRVRVAASGPEALAVWEAAPDDFNLLLTDIVMPRGVSGIELAERLCARRPALKVVYMSGYGGDTLAGRDIREAPLNHILLQKPFQVRQLARALRQALDER